MDQFNPHRFCVAPMMDGTDRHCRYFHRLISRHARLYSEMITADAVIHGDRDYLLGFDKTEHPVALQLGGSDPVSLGQAATIGEDFGYDEINLNVGCPSDRVQSGAFGACLMQKPDLVGDCVSAMLAAVNIPVTVKCRIGVDEQDPYEMLPSFIEVVKQAGCDVFIIHARKAWLQGLSPKENRTVPPLDYSLVRHVKKQNPDLTIVLNGGLETIEHCTEELAHVDGVMLGRAPYANPWLLSDVDEMLFNSKRTAISRDDVAMQMHDYVFNIVTNGGAKPHAITRHILGLYKGAAGARFWRQTLSQGASLPVDCIPLALENMAQGRPSAA